jgi:hypothetical protein
MASELRVNTITSTTGVGTVTLGSSGVSFSGTPTFNDVTLSSINSGPLAGLRNLIINGGYDIWQRGTSFTSNTSYTADRWWMVNDAVGTATITRQDISTQGLGSQYCLRAERSAGTNRWVIGTQLETSVVKSLLGKKVTLSFYLRKGSALTSDVTATLATSSTEAIFGSAVDSITITASNSSINASTFTKFSGTLTIPTSSSALGIKVEFSANQTGASNAYFEVAQVQLEEGSTATPFERRIISQELEMCQRYYEKSYDYSVIPGSVADAGAWESISINVADFYDFGRLMFKTRKRSTAVVSLWSTNGVAGQWRNISANSNQGNSGSSNASETGAHLFCNNNAMTANNAFRTQWTASAEL